MYSHLFCRTVEVQEAYFIEEDNPSLKLYKIELLNYQESVARLIKLLSTSERDRANRYHFIKDKNRFIICRSFLKLLLADNLNLKLDQIHIAIDANKKPYLTSHPTVFFNVSHAGDYALIAIGKFPIGIDIELINKNFDYKEILPNIFNENEIDEIKLTQEKHHTFYNLWTRKEAIVKAIGTGIDDAISKIPVTDGLHVVPSTLIGDFKTIKVFSFKLNNDYVGALAITEDLTNFEKISFYPVPKEEELKSILY